ncbi:MAG: hydrogenase 4 subunit F [Deltaproteobacteria bacterium]|nr:hydrogenase 4 subunit F [Deltaproteobacteria bacterium]
MLRHLPWLLPVVPLTTAALMLLFRNRKMLAALDVLGSASVAVLSLVLAKGVLQQDVLAAGAFRADALTAIFLLLISLLAFATSIYTTGWMKEELESGEMHEALIRYYYALVHAFIATMLFTVLADDLGVLWIAMEGTTITSALLVGFHGNRFALEAAWKYIIVTTIGISFGLFGTVLIYAAATHVEGAGVVDAMSWSSVAGVAGQLDPGIVRMGFIFVVVGYGTKAGLAPTHMWLPDAHSQAPSPVSALLSGALIKCALFGIIRFHTIARGACGPEVSGQLLLIFGLISVVFATPFILAQNDLKRLLGYHSVEHVGIVALGLGFGGPIGTYGALLHAINHGVTKALVFFVSGDVIGRYESRNMHEIRGLLRVAPAVGVLLLLGAFSLAGTPPFSIFLSELLVIRAGIASGHPFVLGVFLLMVVIIFAGLIHHAGGMAFGVPASTEHRPRSSRSPLLGMSILAAVMIALGLYLPNDLHRLLVRATEIVLG